MCDQHYRTSFLSIICQWIRSLVARHWKSLTPAFARVIALWMWRVTVRGCSWPLPTWAEKLNHHRTLRKLTATNSSPKMNFCPSQPLLYKAINNSLIFPAETRYSLKIRETNKEMIPIYWKNTRPSSATVFWKRLSRIENIQCHGTITLRPFQMRNYW